MSGQEEAHGHDEEEHEGMHKGGVPYYGKRVMALEALLEEKGILTGDEVQRLIDLTDAVSPKDGARVVARAWIDAEYKARLLAEPKKTLEESGYGELPEDPVVVVVENSGSLRHLVVCTLCSCYPRMLLGRPPDWYKSLAYRSRAVNDPRGVMAEFGHHVPEDVEVRVLDSTADIRYLVIPERPEGTDGWTEEELVKLVTRDSMIGAGAPLKPEQALVG